MSVTGIDVPNNTTIKSVSHATSSTTITITNNATASATVILQFTNSSEDGLLLTPEKSTNVIDNLDWSSGDNFITANSVDDISGLEIGMLVYHEDFPVGTK